MLSRAVAPELYPPKFTDIKLPVRTDLANGLAVYIFNKGEQEVFKIEFLVSTESNNNYNPAVAALCMAMLREGTISRSAKTINNSLDYLGAFLELKSGLDYNLISLYGRSVYVKELISLVTDIILRPSFNEKAIEKHKSRMMLELLIEQKKTSYWAPRLLRKNIFGNNHPYSILITEDDINSITRADLFQYHQNVIIPGLQNIIIAGSFIEQEISQLLNNDLNHLIQNSSKDNVTQPAPDETKLISKNLINSKQASIAIGKEAIKITNPNYSTCALLTKILGGYFGSRLMKKLREEEGLTYGIHAYNVHLLSGSYLQISADVELTSVDKSVELVMAEIEILQTKGIAETELATVKNYMIGEFMNDSNTVFDFADLYKKLLLQKLPVNFYHDYYSKLSLIKPNEIITSAQELFKPGEFSIIKVG